MEQQITTLEFIRALMVSLPMLARVLFFYFMGWRGYIELKKELKERNKD